jgi:hypothetical protein
MSVVEVKYSELPVIVYIFRPQVRVGLRGKLRAVLPVCSQNSSATSVEVIDEQQFADQDASRQA